MKPNKHILLYITLSLFSIYIFLVFFTYQTFRKNNGVPLEKSNYLLPHKQIALFNKKSLPITCNPNSESLIFPLTYEEFQTKSSWPIISCQEICTLQKSDQTIIKLIARNDPETAVTSINQIIVDEKSKIISYLIDSPDSSIRIVIDWEGKLLHWIDENPGKNYTLTLNHYNSKDQTFVYQSTDGNTYHYLANGVGLYRNPCN